MTGRPAKLPMPAGADLEDDLSEGHAWENHRLADRLRELVPYLQARQPLPSRRPDPAGERWS